MEQEICRELTLRNGLITILLIIADIGPTLRHIFYDDIYVALLYIFFKKRKYGL